MEKRYSVSGNFQEETWNKLSELLEFFKRESIGKVSTNDALKICVNHTYKTIHVYEELVEEVGQLKSENCELKKRVRELEEEINTVIARLTNCLEMTL